MCSWLMDFLSKEKRSELMRSIKGKNTKPEILVRQALHKLGFRFRLNQKGLPGSPDLVLKKYNTVIFVNGCFWHGHAGCKRGSSLPKTNTEFWAQKIATNKERDIKKCLELQKLGWSVITIHECELKISIIKETILRVTEVLKKT